MKRSLFLAIVATIALVSAPAQAQLGMLKPFQLGIAGGAAQPMSDLSNDASTGFNGTVAMAINLPFIPVGLRVDGAYNQFGEKSGAVAGAKLHIMSATGNVVVKLPSVGINPYLIGGAGLYMPTVTAPGLASSTENHFGWNAGAGISLPVAFAKTFIEARYNNVSVDGGSLKFVPVTFGIMF